MTFAPIVDSNPLSVPGRMGNIYQYSQGNPYGPYAGLPRLPGQSPGINPGGSGGSGGSGSGGGISGGSDGVALDYLKGVVGGQNTPYNEDTRTSMYSRASGMNAAAEGAQNQQLQSGIAAGGGSASDPSAMSALRQNMANRQGANQRAMGDIDRTANVANQQASQQAANSLLAHDTAMNAQNAAASQAAMGYLYGGSGGGRSSNYQGNGFLQYGQSPRDAQYAQEDADWNNRQGIYSGMSPRGTY